MFRNSEGYPDPTAGTAIAHILREQKLKKKHARLKELEDAKWRQAILHSHEAQSKYLNFLYVKTAS